MTRLTVTFRGQSPASKRWFPAQIVGDEVQVPDPSGELRRALCESRIWYAQVGEGAPRSHRATWRSVEVGCVVLTGKTVVLRVA